MKDISWPHNYSSFQLPLRIKTKHLKKEKSFLGKNYKKNIFHVSLRVSLNKNDMSMIAMQHWKRVLEVSLAGT